MKLLALALTLALALLLPRRAPALTCSLQRARNLAGCLCHARLVGYLRSAVSPRERRRTANRCARSLGLRSRDALASLCARFAPGAERHACARVVAGVTRDWEKCFGETPALDDACEQLEGDA